MEIKRISKGQIPPEHKYILIYVGGRFWSDSDDQEGKYWRVAKMVKGISSKERMELSMKGDTRADEFWFGDEDGNNEVPYRFDEFGPDDHFGQNVDIWCELPKLDGMRKKAAR